jgi:hypothetical protein
MPSYTFKNTETNEQFDSVMSIAARTQYLEENPHIIQLIGRAPSIGDSIRLGIRKPDDGFRDVLKNVQHHHKKDNINTW